MEKETRKEYSVYLSASERKLIEDAAFVVREKTAVYARDTLLAASKAIVEARKDSTLVDIPATVPRINIDWMDKK